MISSEQVSCFTAVYELQSYSAASQKLGKARSTVRERVNALEDTMGVKLFNIEGKKAVPTDIALRLYPRARLLARQTIEFENIALSAYLGELTNITIFHDSGTPIQFILAIEEAIKKEFTGVHINWLQRDRDHCFDSIENGDVLLAIMPGLGNLHPSSGIGSINLGTHPLLIYTAVDSNIPTRPVSIAELSTELQLITENDFNSQHRHTKISSEYELVTSPQLLTAKLKQNGWAVLSESDAEEHVKSGELRKVELAEAPSDIRQDLVMFYNMSAELSQQQSKVIDIVTQVAKAIQLGRV